MVVTPASLTANWSATQQRKRSMTAHPLYVLPCSTDLLASSSRRPTCRQAEFERWAPSLRVVVYKGTAAARADVWATQVRTYCHTESGVDPPWKARPLRHLHNPPMRQKDHAHIQVATLQVKRRQAAFDVLLTTYELIMAPADGQRLSQLRWNYIMCAPMKSATFCGCQFWGHIADSKPCVEQVLTQFWTMMQCGRRPPPQELELQAQRSYPQAPMFAPPAAHRLAAIS